MTEMQIRGEATTRIFGRLIAIRGVAVEHPVQKRLQSRLARQRPTGLRDAGHLVIDRQPGQVRCTAFRHVCDRPAVMYRRRHEDRVRRPELGRQSGQRILCRQVVQVRRKRPLQEASEGVCRGERPIGGSERQQTVGVDGLEPDLEARSDGGEHPRQEERGVFIRDHDRGPVGQRLHETASRAFMRLDVGIVGDALRSQT